MCANPQQDRLLMRVSCNGFTITNADGEDVGIGLFLGTATTD